MSVGVFLIGSLTLEAGAVRLDQYSSGQRANLIVKATTSKVRQQLFRTNWKVVNQTRRVVRIKSCEAFVWVIGGPHLNDYTHLRSVRVKGGRTARFQVEWRSTRLVYGIGPELATRVNRCRLRS
jgi:hypothetical protein